MKLIVIVDFKVLDKVTEFLKNHLDEEFVVLDIQDENIIKVSIEPALMRGWFGEREEEKIIDVLNAQLEKKRKEFYEKIEVFENVKLITECGNYKEILESHIVKNNIKEVIVFRSKGYNPYWKVVKYIIKDVCKTHKISFKILS